MTPSDLPSIIKSIILEKGKITFREFMELALYHPRFGYYMSPEKKIGKEGDFYTSPDVHKVFGTVIMKQLKEMRKLLSAGNTFHVIEGGAGKGSMCCQILDAAREREEELYHALHYHIVEKSDALAEIQKENIKEANHTGKVTWHKDIKGLLNKAKTAVVLSNELIDAFPVHRVIFNGRQWEEIYVRTEGENFSEETGPLSNDELKHSLSLLEDSFTEGYTTEINVEGPRWITDVAKNLEKGFILTIDYGYPRGDYYSPLRNAGTFLCYYQHTTCEDPYIRVGEQDITAHVDFSSLAEAGKEEGLELTGYCEQFHFLMGLGVFDEFHANDEANSFNTESLQENMAIKRLLMPDAMGGTFKVLIQHKGMKKPALKAFSFKDLSHRL